LRRFLEWFWRGRALTGARSQAATTARVIELRRRASLAAHSAEKTLYPMARLQHGAAVAIACDLYRQSIAWSLEALRASGAASVDAEAEALDAEFAGKSFADLADLAATAQAELAAKLRSTAERLLRATGAQERAVERLRAQRSIRIGSVVLVLVVIVGASLAGGDWMIDRGDLAHGRAWKTSSLSPGLGCISPSQTCGANFFFHTDKETDPWVEVYLGRVLRISSIEVQNRTDCCMERAVPLTVEVSTNQKKWKQVAQRKEPFTTWSPVFSPNRARYVRLKLKGEGPLHLARIRVFD